MASMVKGLLYLRWLVATAFLHLFLTRESPYRKEIMSFDDWYTRHRRR
jgi:hypothetical protein